MTENYHIGTPGIPWTQKEKKLWLQKQKVQRSYQKDVPDELKNINSEFETIKYGELSYKKIAFKDYPLYIIKNKNWDVNKKTILVT